MNLLSASIQLWRSTKARAVAGVIVMAAGSMMGGCQNNGDLVEANRTLTERIEALLQENRELKSQLELAQGELAGQRKANGDLLALRDRLEAENQNLRDMLKKFQGDIGDLKFQALDPSTDAALRELAAQYPDLLEYDAARGMIRFKSDVTFASGSDEVTSAAKPSIDALARILVTDAASAYDVRIVGHTDSQRISPGTAKKHATNWHLSTHRAISVGRELISTGVTATRVEAAGRGEFDPLVTNSGNGNTPQNRRVEVFLVRGVNKQGVIGASAPTNAPSGRPAATPKRPAEEIMK